MVRKISSMGDNTHSGINVDIIKNMGDAKLYDCTAKEAKIMGEALCNKCRFEELSCMGESEIIDSEIGSAKLMGQSTIKNSKFSQFSCLGNVEISCYCEADNINIMGNLEAEKLKCGILTVGAKNHKGIFSLFNRNKSIISSDVRINGNIYGETFESMLCARISGDVRFNNILLREELIADIDLSCESFYSLNRINISNINAEYVFIRPVTESKLKSIVGTKVMICRDFSVTPEFEKIPKSYSSNSYEQYDKEAGIMEIDFIEADDIYVENINANYLRGQNIVIGKNCKIGHVEYTENAEVSKDSSVSDIVKEDK